MKPKRATIRMKVALVAQVWLTASVMAALVAGALAWSFGHSDPKAHAVVSRIVWTLDAFNIVLALATLGAIAFQARSAQAFFKASMKDMAEFDAELVKTKRRWRMVGDEEAQALIRQMIEQTGGEPPEETKH